MTITSTSTSKLAVVIISIVAIIIAIILVFILVIIRSRQRSVSWNCPPGSCPTSIATGEKDCSRIEYNPAYEVCSNQYSCDNQALPYTVLSDNGTNLEGQCDSDTPCRCVRMPTCPQYTTSVFDVSNQYISQQSYQAGQSVSSLCSITTDSLFGEQGYCISTEDWSTSGGKLTDVVRCVQSNPCMFGQLAYIGDPNALTINSYHYYPLACVVGRTGYDSFDQPLQSGAITIWDNRWGGVVQKIL